MKHWIISDTHYGHQFLIDLGDRLPGYEYKINRSLTKLLEEDVLIHLGDICIGNDMEVHNKYIKPLKCKKILVKGNHDRKTDNRYLENGWDMVVDKMVLSMFGKVILFTHIPTDETLEWVMKEDNRLVMHGHRHHHFRKTRIRELERHILISCEYQNYQARTIKYMLGEGKDIRRPLPDNSKNNENE